VQRRIVYFVLFAVLAAALFVALGFWQLRRRQERLALNAIVRGHFAAPTADFSALPHDTAQTRYRRARVSGIPDYEHEIVLAGRSRDGSPGVDIVTPVRIAGPAGGAVLVVRGWVYSPDAYHVDLARWHDRDSTFTGYVERIAPSTPGAIEEQARATSRMVQRLDSATVARLVPYPVARFYLVALEDSSSSWWRRDSAVNRVARLGPPVLDEGPHLGYAIQWFSFAAIAVFGAGAIAVKTRNETAQRQPVSLPRTESEAGNARRGD
jgi:surfeit locus 1 family protein